jgi:Sec-independent protein secretion pathway component TatC
MFSSVPLMSVFTVLFLATGVYSIVRLAALASGVSSGLYFLIGAVFAYRAPVAGGYHPVMALAML